MVPIGLQDLLHSLSSYALVIVFEYYRRVAPRCRQNLSLMLAESHKGRFIVFSVREICVYLHVRG